MTWLLFGNKDNSNWFQDSASEKEIKFCRVLPRYMLSMCSEIRQKLNRLVKLWRSNYVPRKHDASKRSIWFLSEKENFLRKCLPTKSCIEDMRSDAVSSLHSWPPVESIELRRPTREWTRENILHFAGCADIPPHPNTCFTRYPILSIFAHIRALLSKNRS